MVIKSSSVDKLDIATVDPGASANVNEIPPGAVGMMDVITGVAAIVGEAVIVGVTIIIGWVVATGVNEAVGEGVAIGGNAVVGMRLGVVVFVAVGDTVEVAVKVGKRATVDVIVGLTVRVAIDWLVGVMVTEVGEEDLPAPVGCTRDVAPGVGVSDAAGVRAGLWLRPNPLGMSSERMMSR